jgi:threonine/homoserine/homoserine lactone efflux protein
MIDPSLFLRGLLIGLAIAAPVGPIGLLCIQRTLALGRSAGFLSGLGAATADGFYGAVAAFGLTLVSHALLAERMWIQAFGGVALVYIGIRMATRPVTRQGASASGGKGWLLYGSVLLLTLGNPLTILSFAAVFATLDVSLQQHAALAAAFTVLGVFSGSALWWLSLSTVVARVGRTLQPRVLRLIGGAAGTLIAVVGLVGLATSGVL